MRGPQELHPILINKEALRLYRTHLVYLLNVGLCNALVVLFLPIPVLNIALAFVFGMLSLAVLWLIDKEERRKRINLLQAVRHALFRILPMLGVGIVVHLIVFAGFVLLVIPGIIWALMYSQAGMFVLLDNQGVLQGLSSSQQVTKGYRVAILFSYLPIAAPSLLAIWVIEVFLMRYNHFAYFLFGLAASTLFTPVIMTLTYVIWRNLMLLDRRSKLTKA